MFTHRLAKRPSLVLLCGFLNLGIAAWAWGGGETIKNIALMTAIPVATLGALARAIHVGIVFSSSSVGPFSTSRAHYVRDENPRAFWQSMGFIFGVYIVMTLVVVVGHVDELRSCEFAREGRPNYTCRLLK